MATDKPPIENAAANHLATDAAPSPSHKTGNKRLSFVAGPDDAVQTLPAMPSGSPSNVEGYSIYSNIKDGKVRETSYQTGYVPASLP